MRFLNYKKYNYNEKTGLKKISYIKTLSHSTLSVLICAVILVNLTGVLIVNVVTEYNEKQRRTPRALNSSGAEHPQAADSLLKTEKYEKILDLPENIKAQLKDDSERQKNGSPKDLTRIRTLEEGRSENTKVFLNVDGSKSVEQSVDATSYKDPEGIWRDIDSTLTKDPNGNGIQKQTHGELASDQVKVV